MDPAIMYELFYLSDLLLIAAGIGVLIYGGRVARILGIILLICCLSLLVIH